MNANQKKICYKYAKITREFIWSIYRKKLRFSNPDKFNDPLDSSPAIEADIELVEITEANLKLLTHIENRKSQSDRFKNHELINFEKISKRHLQSAKDEFLLRSVEIERHIAKLKLSRYGRNEFLKRAHCNNITKNLQKLFACGILSLTTNEKSPLMWSHYADHHKGICVGFTGIGLPISSINYSSELKLRASLIKNYLDGNNVLKDTIRDTIFLRKLMDWEYEKELRMFYRPGDFTFPFEIREIIFGLRCNEDFKYLLFKLFSGIKQESGIPIFYSVELDSYSNEITKMRYSGNQHLEEHYKSLRSKGELINEIDRLQNL